MRNIMLGIRGLFFKVIRFSSWKKFFKGKYVFAKAKSFEHSGLLLLNDFVELKGKTKNIHFGTNCFIGKSTVIKANFNEDSFFSVGDNFGCGEFCYFGCAGGVEIGNDVMMGQNVRFHAQNHIFSNPDELMSKQGTTQEGIKIGNDCWFGSGSVVVDGVTIGNGCVIGTNAVITKDVPDYSIVVGNPGRIIKSRKAG